MCVTVIWYGFTLLGVCSLDTLSYKSGSKKILSLTTLHLSADASYAQYHSTNYLFPTSLYNASGHAL